MQVDDAEIGVMGLLERDPVRYGPQVVTQMELSRRLDTTEYAQASVILRGLVQGLPPAR
jgi:hypothetical protein